MIDSILFLLVFCLIILLSNIIQGITGFAGTMLAMPFICMLTDIDTAKQVLNFLGLVASLIIVTKNYRFIKWHEVARMLIFMVLGLVIGIGAYSYLPRAKLKIIFSVFILIVGIQGLLNIFVKNTNKEALSEGTKEKVKSIILLICAGIVHGLFVSGGSLLVAYAAKRIPQKQSFRATISVIWIVLNSILFSQGLVGWAISINILNLMGIALLPMFAGIFIGEILAKKLSQHHFIILSYVLLIVSGVSLLI